MRLLFLGDTHGNTNWVQLVIETAKEHDVDWIVQVGDFGYWEHKQHGVDFLFDVQAVLDDNDMQMVWIDGNHEAHPIVRRNYGPSSDRHQVHPEFGFWRIRDNLWHAPRGHRWVWDDVKFLALGGAYSIDKGFRKVGSSWWWEELITEDEVDDAIAGGAADVMVTHDCPAGVQGAIPELGGLDRQKDRWPESLENRRKLRRVVDEVRPFALVHGHYHHRNTELLPLDDGWEVLIEGLACDEMSGAALIWITEELARRV